MADSFVVNIERAWRDLLGVLAFKNPGLVKEQQRAQRAIRSLMAKR